MKTLNWFVYLFSAVTFVLFAAAVVMGTFMCIPKQDPSMPEVYQVVFETNGGVGQKNTQTFMLGEAKRLSNINYTKPGFTFKGWATTPTGAVVYKNAEEVIDLCKKNGDSLTLYAVWEEVPVITLTFNANNGTEAYKFYGDSSLLSNYPNNTDEGFGFSKTGYDFSGWNTKADGSGDFYLPGATSAFSSNVFYADWTKQGLVCKKLEGTSGCLLTGYALDSQETSTGIVVLPDYYKGEKITHIKSGVFYQNTTIKEITLPMHVVKLSHVETSSGNKGTFEESSIEKINYKENSSLKIIGSNCFKKCTNLTSFDFTDGLVSIFDYAFNLTKLTKADFPDSLAFIGSSAFDACDALTEVTFGSGFNQSTAPVVEYDLTISTVFGILYDIFKNCTALVKADLSKCVELKELDGMFNGCTALTSVGTSESSTASVKLPQSLIEMNDFNNCTGITTLDLTKLTSLKKLGGFDKTSITTLDVANIELISISGFCRCKNLTEVSLPATLTELGVGSSGEGIFYNSKYINQNAYNDNGLIYSSGMKDGAEVCKYLISFNVDHSDRDLIIDAATKVIADGVMTYSNIYNIDFSSCSELTHIGSSFNYSNIINLDLSACTSLVSLRGFDGSNVSTINLDNCDSLTEINGFNWCNQLESLSIEACPNLQSIIGFKWCNQLESLSLEGCINLKVIKGFSDCEGLSVISLPNSITTLGGSLFDTAFENTDYYNDVNNWVNGVIYISSSDNSCKYLLGVNRDADGKDIVIDKNTKCISDSAFDYYDSEDSEFELSLKSLSFAGCDKLVSIGMLAFAGISIGGEIDLSPCTALKTIDSWGLNAEGYTNVIIGQGVETIGLAAIHVDIEDPAKCPTITFLSETVPAHLDPAWTAFQIKRTIYVPQSAVETYKAYFSREITSGHLDILPINK